MNADPWNRISSHRANSVCLISVDSIRLGMCLFGRYIHPPRLSRLWLELRTIRINTIVSFCPLDVPRLKAEYIGPYSSEEF